MNLANKLTVLRIILVPIFMFFVLTQWVQSPYNLYLAAGIFVIASITDSLDGYIARSKNMVTTIGKFLDPLADKLLVTAALVSLVQIKQIDAWIVVIIISREFIVTTLRVVAAAEGKIIAASGWGKIKTITQIVAIIALLLGNWPFSLVSIPFSNVMVYLMVIVTIISGYDYVVKNKEIIFKGKM